MDRCFIAGKLTRHGKEVCGKTASFLGSEGASLTDLDDLFSFNTKPKQQTLGDTLAVQAQAIGKDQSNASVWVESAVWWRLRVELLLVRLVDGWINLTEPKNHSKNSLAAC